MSSRYLPTNSLPPQASPTQIAHLQRAAQGNQIFFQDLAKRSVHAVFKTTTDQIIRAIRLHLQAERKVYCKYQTGSSMIIPHKIQTNLRLDEDVGEDSDIYVEFVLAAPDRVYIRNAHHHGNAPRLPR